MESDIEINKRNEFDQIITKRQGNSWISPPKIIMQPSDGSDSGENKHDDMLDTLEKDSEEMDEDGTALQHSLIDTLIHAEVLLPHNG